jgi:hypothetical protein
MICLKHPYHDSMSGNNGVLAGPTSMLNVERKRIHCTVAPEMRNLASSNTLSMGRLLIAVITFLVNPRFG